MKRKSAKPDNIIFQKYKVVDIILSCRTIPQIESAQRMVDNFAKGHSLDFCFEIARWNIYLEKRKRVIQKYANTLEGADVMVVTNENELIKHGTLLRFYDFEKPNTDLFPIVKFEDDEKEYIAMGIVLPFNEKFQKELNELPYKVRRDAAIEMRSDLNYPY